MKGIIIVLGSPNMDTGALFSIAIERCEQALLEYARHPGYKLLLTGGYGSHFNTTTKPHAFYLKQYLTSHGIPAEDILEFAESSNTLEDASLSRPIVARYGIKQVIIVTSDYHLDRAAYIFQREFAGIEMTLSACQTNEANCKLDLEALKQHEKRALAKLQLPK